MAQVVYSNVENAGSDTRSLFNGKKFWLSTRVPMRKRFVDEVKVSRSLAPWQKLEAN